MPDSRYRITERVAAGGMAEVFKGVAESLQGFKKNIAIKRILPSLTKNKKFVAMFLDEARLSLSLQHANIVQVFDIGHSEDTYFIVMEFVDGVDLKAVIEWRRRLGKRLPVGQSLYVMMEICKGLSYAHDLTNPDTGKPVGIVHRDISPPNVLISKQGEVKVVDFGLAKATSQIETTDPGVVKGKMAYLSPEAARGEEVDARADIFAVGILLYELLTGKRLFYGESDYQTVELVRNAKIPPIAAQNPEVEPELEDVVRKSLARRLEDRFQSATDLQDALAHYVYSRGLKVIARDIADIVRLCNEERSTQSGAARKAQGSIIDTLLNDEIVKFTSVDFEDPGAKPIGPGDVAQAPPPGGDFIDPRDWADDVGARSSKDGPAVDGGKSKPSAAVRQPGGTPQPAGGGGPPGAGAASTTPARSSGQRAAVAAPSDGAGADAPLAAQAAAARSTGKSMQAVGQALPDTAFGGGPTPGLDSLVRVLEPTPVYGTASKKKKTGGIVIGLIIAVVVAAVGAAAMFFRTRGN